MSNETMHATVLRQRAWAVRPAIRRIHLSDLRTALAAGWDDFRANPTHLVLLGIIYPVAGLVLGRLASGAHALPLIWPLVAGFALLGPLAAVGLYELSRQRERGQPVTWQNAFDVLRAKNLGAIVILGLALATVFGAWLLVALRILGATMPEAPSDTVGQFATAVITTTPGWHLIVVGTAAGFAFALVVLTYFVISFPLLIDRDAGRTVPEQVSTALAASARAMRTNPVPMLAWGLIVAVGLAAGFATALVGLALVMPVLGHATWHLYRRLVA